MTLYICLMLAIGALFGLVSKEFFLLFTLKNFITKLLWTCLLWSSFSNKSLSYFLSRWFIAPWQKELCTFYRKLTTRSSWPENTQKIESFTIFFLKLQATSMKMNYTRDFSKMLKWNSHKDIFIDCNLLLMNIYKQLFFKDFACIQETLVCWFREL